MCLVHLLGGLPLLLAAAAGADLGWDGPVFGDDCFGFISGDGETWTWPGRWSARAKRPCPRNWVTVRTPLRTLIHGWNTHWIRTMLDRRTGPPGSTSSTSDTWGRLQRDDEQPLSATRLRVDLRHDDCVASAATSSVILSPARPWHTHDNSVATTQRRTIERRTCGSPAEMLSEVDREVTAGARRPRVRP